MSKKKYASVAEKQKAWRIRSGKQKRKVPLAIRRGERTGASETELRERKEGETWEEYHEYIDRTVSVARRRQVKAGGTVAEIDNKEDSIGAKRVAAGYKEPEFKEDYYEARYQHEKELEKLPQKGKKFEQKRRKPNRK